MIPTDKSAEQNRDPISPCSRQEKRDNVLKQNLSQFKTYQFCENTHKFHLYIMVNFKPKYFYQHSQSPTVCLIYSLQTKSIDEMAVDMPNKPFCSIQINFPTPLVYTRLQSYNNSFKTSVLCCYFYASPCSSLSVIS